MITWVYAKTYEEMCDKAADKFDEVLKQKPDAVFGLATGSTPEGLYSRLCRRVEEGGMDFSRAVSVNLDEYVGLSEQDEQSYRAFMNKHLFSRVPFLAHYLPDGKAFDPDEEAKRYASLLDRAGTRDLQLLGIGYNGHIGFCEPSDAVFTRASVVALTQSTIEANARFFDSVFDVPTHAISMGMAQIFDAKQILLLAGESKHEILHRALEGPITTMVPASLLQLHSCVTVMEVVK